jgi:hypothetical protein
MSNGFGFEQFPQRPSPNPREVGAELARARFRQMPSPGRVAQLTQQRPDASAVSRTPPPESPVFDPDLWTPPTDRLHQAFRALAAQGGYETSGGGQTGTGSAPPGQPDYPVADNEAHSAMHAAVGAAATRIANGVMRNHQVGDEHRARRREQILRLGITPFEADLLSRTGGI